MQAMWQPVPAWEPWWARWSGRQMRLMAVSLLLFSISMDSINAPNLYLKQDLWWEQTWRLGRAAGSQHRGLSFLVLGCLVYAGLHFPLPQHLFVICMKCEYGHDTTKLLENGEIVFGSSLNETGSVPSANVFRFRRQSFSWNQLNHPLPSLGKGLLGTGENLELVLRPDQELGSSKLELNKVNQSKWVTPRSWLRLFACFSAWQKVWTSAFHARALQCSYIRSK